MYFCTVATLSSIASALTCFAALWIPCSSHKTVAVLSIVYTILGGYTLLLACLSPTPPLYDSDLGSVIIVEYSFFFKGLYVFKKKNDGVRCSCDTVSMHIEEPLILGSRLVFLICILVILLS